jgi:hypothetical protein
MNTIPWICLGAGMFVTGVLAFALFRAAAPKNRRDRMIDDYEQMKALGYFKNKEEQIEAMNYVYENITSGSAVVKEG